MLTTATTLSRLLARSVETSEVALSWVEQSAWNNVLACK